MSTCPLEDKLLSCVMTRPARIPAVAARVGIWPQDRASASLASFALYLKLNTKDHTNLDNVGTHLIPRMFNTTPTDPSLYSARLIIGQHPKRKFIGEDRLEGIPINGHGYTA